MVAVTELGYMGFGVKDIAAWRDYAASVVGFEVADDGEADRCYLRMDYWHHRFVLHAGGDDDLAYAGFRVAGPAEFEAMQRQLSDAGIAFRIGTAAQAQERRVLELLSATDPDGTPIEIFHGPFVEFSKPFHPGRRMHGRFLTGSGGLGHCILRQRDPAAAFRFYSALGMRGSVEYVVGRGGRSLQIQFMHCNERDHTVAFGVPGTRRINHVMLEVDTLDDVGMTHDLVRSRKVPVEIGLGKHSNDHMFSFYFRNPSGWMFEYGCGGRPATHQSEYYAGDIFGHHPEAGGFGPPPQAVETPEGAVQRAAG